LTESCVSSGMALRKGTEILANWGDHPHTQEGGWKEMQKLPRHFSP